jgi:hypothetical protein
MGADIGSSPISGYRVIPDIGYFPISGNTSYWEIPDIGSQNEARYRYQDIRTSGHVYPDIRTHDIGIGCPDIFSDIVPDIMTVLQPVLLFPAAAAAAAAAAAYPRLKDPCY